MLLTKETLLVVKQYFGFWMEFMEIIYLSVLFPLALMVEQEGYCLSAAYPPFFWETNVCDGWSLIQLDFSDHLIL